MTRWQPLSIADAYRAVTQGTGLWIAFGTFVDDWRYAAQDSAVKLSPLLLDPIVAVAPYIQEAVFFQAVAEHLLVHTAIDIPTADWIVRPRWSLPTPWFLYPGPRLRAWQLATTPAALKARNIFSGDRLFDRA